MGRKTIGQGDNMSWEQEVRKNLFGIYDPIKQVFYLILAHLYAIPLIIFPSAWRFFLLDADLYVPLSLLAFMLLALLVGNFIQCLMKSQGYFKYAYLFLIFSILFGGDSATRLISLELIFMSIMSIVYLIYLLLLDSKKLRNHTH